MTSTRMRSKKACSAACPSTGNSQRRKRRPGFLWIDEDAAAANYARAAIALSKAALFFRANGPGGGGGLYRIEAHGKVSFIADGKGLSVALVDLVDMQRMKNGKTVSPRLPRAVCDEILRSEVFLEHFDPVDRVTDVPEYLPDFQLTEPKYNDGGPGHRCYYTGRKPKVAKSLTTINRFLDVMDFESNADRTNAVAAALTVMLRGFWPGKKPIINVTATKSQSGKDVILDFAAGVSPFLEFCYEPADWALRKEVTAGLIAEPSVAMIRLGNVRSEGRTIQSAFIEQFSTSAKPLLSSASGNMSQRSIDNHYVVGISTNFGQLSEDLLNRGLPIHLAPKGDVIDRRPSIGNPREDYLPKNREKIAAELRGMIDRWQRAGMPLDNDARHAFTEWAATVGGILKLNGFEDFLGNYRKRRLSDDPVREGIGMLGRQCVDIWLTMKELIPIAEHAGVLKMLVPPNYLSSSESKSAGLGKRLGNHIGETFVVETECERIELRLERQRRRFEKGEEPTLRYCFQEQNRTLLKLDV